MVALAEAAIIIWDGVSKGTKNTINRCHSKDIPVRVYDKRGQLIQKDSEVILYGGASQ